MLLYIFSSYNSLTYSLTGMLLCKWMHWISFYWIKWMLNLSIWIRAKPIIIHKKSNRLNYCFVFIHSACASIKWIVWTCIFRVATPNDCYFDPFTRYIHFHYHLPKNLFMCIFGLFLFRHSQWLCAYGFFFLRGNEQKHGNIEWIEMKTACRVIGSVWMHPKKPTLGIQINGKYRLLSKSIYSYYTRWTHIKIMMMLLTSMPNEYVSERRHDDTLPTNATQREWMHAWVSACVCVCDRDRERME